MLGHLIPAVRCFIPELQTVDDADVQDMVSAASLWCLSDPWWPADKLQAELFLQNLSFSASVAPLMVPVLIQLQQLV